jgi:hypothetical protein
MSEVQPQGASDGSPPAPPATATEASARLTALSGDKAWSGKLLSGDLAATKEFNDLTTMVAESGDGVAVAMSGVLPPAANGEMREMAGTAEFLRDVGIRDEVVRETLAGAEVTQAEFDATKRWHDQHMRDQEFTKKWLAGDPEAARQMTLAHIILGSNIKGVQGRF